MELIQPEPPSTGHGNAVDSEREEEPVLSNLGLTGRNNEDVPSVNTYLPHWTHFERKIHALCKQSRFWNTVVNALEVRFNKEELLSLPQYMGLCPTGQCNAMCDFCSVTKNRTGIIKKQLPWESLLKFIQPVSKTIRMFGLEGNGEPTLYDHFDELFCELTKDGAWAYLITNGEKLDANRIHLMANNRLNAVNFSLNAATPWTHKEVMKLKLFHTVVENIREIARYRNEIPIPMVAVSMVVTAQNIHEVREFLLLAEQDLRANHIHIRPLSEIANEFGAVEDSRIIVPYESDVRDMIEEVQEYMSDVKRRSHIFFSPETFRAWKPDPVDHIIQPVGFEGRWLPPRRSHWKIRLPSASVSWSGTKVEVSCPMAGEKAVFWESAYVPVEVFSTITFKCHTRIQKGEWHLCFYNQKDHLVSTLDIKPSSNNEWRQTIIPIFTGSSSAIKLIWSYSGPTCFGEVEFEKVRTPGFILDKKFTLPSKERWEICSPEAQVAWQENQISIKWDGPSGPYIIKSYSVPCRKFEAMQWPLNIEVGEGVLGIGILTEDASSWVQQFSFGSGTHNTPLLVQPGQNRRLQVVLYSCRKGELSATIDWGDLLEKKRELCLPVLPKDQRDWTVTRIVRSGINRVKAKLHEGIKPLALLNLAKERIISVVLYRKRAYYCLKPWMDLNNFTVDGRMDVCCIATGPSQERYALGNIMSQGFQEVWNGEHMQEFRRTVNGPSKLPPCQRCPLAYTPQGPFFWPEHKQESVWLWLVYWPLFWLSWVGIFPWAKKRRVVKSK